MGACQARPNPIPTTEYESAVCPVCLEQMMKYPFHTEDLTFNCQKCNKLYHDQCWRRCINQDGKCPCCRQQIVAEEHMATIRLSQSQVTEEYQLYTMYWFGLPFGEQTPDGRTSICYSNSNCRW